MTDKTTKELQARIFYLEQIIERANSILCDTRAFDIEHSISCHNDSLHLEFRKVATGADQALEILQEVIRARFP